jgi:hypothetical protein
MKRRIGAAFIRLQIRPVAQTDTAHGYYAFLFFVFQQVLFPLRGQRSEVHPVFWFLIVGGSRRRF